MKTPGKNSIIVFSFFMVFVLSGGSASAESFSIDTLRSGKNGADYLVISPKVFHGELKPLLEQRRKDGLRVALVEPKAVYREFDRWPAGPKALRAFIRFAAANWQAPAPKFILLCGDFNVLADYDPDGPMVPTFIVPLTELLEDGDADNIYYTAADAPFADFDGDEAPDLAVGRIPADTPEELKSIVAKILDYENNPVPGPWRRRASVFASTGDFGMFDTTLEELTKRITRNNFSPAFDINMTYAGSKLPYFQLPDDFDKKVLDRFNEGALFMSYIGHGSVTGLSRVCFRGECRNIMTIDRVKDIDTGGRHPFFFSICCLTGKFNIPQDSIAEAMLKNPGGPVGVFAAAEVSGPFANAVLSKDIMYFLINKRPATIGEGVRNLHRGLVQRFDDDRRFLDKQYTMISSKEEIRKQTFDHIYLYNYLGDPATKISYPADNLKISAPEKAAAGDKIVVSASVPGASAGKLLLTLECNPTEMLYDIRGIQDLKGGELKERISLNYAHANDKIAAKVESNLGSDGAAEVEITVPRSVPAGAYFIKGYAWDGVPDSMGMVEIKIAGDAPPVVMEEPEKEKKETTLALLTREIGKIREPDVSGIVPDGGRDKLKPKAESPARISGKESEKEKEKSSRRRGNKSDGFDRDDSLPRPFPKERLKMLEKRLEADPLNAKTAVDLAAAYLAAGKPDSSIALLRRAVLPVRETGLAFQTSALYRSLYQYGDAAAVLEKIINDKSADDKKENKEKFAAVSRACGELARILYAAGKSGEALKVAEERMAYTDNDLDSLKGLLALYREMDGIGDLGKTYRYTPPAHLPDLAKFYFEAEKLAAPEDGIHGDIFYFLANWARDPEAAEKKAHDILRRKSIKNWAEFLPALAKLLLNKDEGNTADAFGLMWKYWKIKGDPNAKAMAAASFVDLLDLQGPPASEYIDLALKISPKCAACATLPWEFWKFSLKNTSGKPDTQKLNSLVDFCGRAAEIEPGFATARRCLAEVFFEKEEYSKAAAQFEALRKLETTELTDREVISAYKSGAGRRALDLLGSARKFNKEYSGDRKLNAAANRMLILGELGEYEAAENVYLAYAKENPESAMIDHYMARVYAGRKDWSAAALHEKYAVGKNPYCRECLAALGDYSLEAGDPAGAEKAYRAAVSLSPANAALAARLARSLFRNGKKDEARRVLFEALQTDPRNTVAEKVLEEFINPDYFFD